MTADVPHQEQVIFNPGSDRAIVNGTEIPIPAPAVVVEGSLYAPLITVADVSGAELEPNAAEQSVTVSWGRSVLKLWLNRCEALHNGEPTRLEAPLIVHKGNVMMPAELLVRFLGASLLVDPRLGAVTLCFPAAV